MRSAPGNSGTLCRAHEAHQMFLPLERAALAGDPSRKHLSRQALRVATWKGCSAAGNSWVGCIFREFRRFFHPWLCSLFVLSPLAVVWQRLGYLSPVWHNLFSLPLPTTRGVHPKPFPTLAGEETTPFHKSRHWNVHSVCIMQCSEEPDSWGDKPAWPVLTRTFIFPGMMSPPRNLSPWLESGISVCGWLSGPQLCPEAWEECRDSARLLWEQLPVRWHPNHPCLEGGNVFTKSVCWR